MRYITAGLSIVGFALACWWVSPGKTQAQQGDALAWIWFDEGEPIKDAPAETRYFRRVFEINRPVPRPIDEAQLDITADNEYTVWINGKEVGRGDDWKLVKRFDVQKFLVNGKNVIAIEAKNHGGPAGLLVRLGYVPNGLSKLAVLSDGSWKCSKLAEKGWEAVEFDDSKWSQVKVIGEYPRDGPWKDLRWEAGGGERFVVPDGFKVEMVVPANPKGKDLDPKLPFSLVNMCFDAKGRLLVSQERGPVVLCSDKGEADQVRVYCDQVKNCQGMCWIKDSLWLVGDGPRGTGLYRCKDTNGDDRIDKNDEVKLLHAFKGGMGEHGPHAIIHGPDDQVYVVIGNHAWAHIGAEAARNKANPAKLAGNSPLTRWPYGTMGPDQGKPGTTEDVLLPRLNDSRGHAKDILAPGGTIWRMDHDGQNMALVAAGFRNQYDAAFSPAGELFTFDSDMEWDEALPWYRPVAIYHCPPGADFMWRTGAANTPWYYIDSLPPVAITGRGSPVGVEWYDHVGFPEKYRTLFVADWSIGVIFAVHLERDGASYKAKTERFCHGAPMNVTDLAVGPDGAMYFTLGGRGTAGGVYRIVYEPGKKAVEEHRKPTPGLVGMIDQPQPLSPFGRASLKELWRESPPKVTGEKLQLSVASEETGVRERIRLMNIWAEFGNGPDSRLLAQLATDKHPEIRAHAVYLLGRYCPDHGKDAVLKALKDEDALVRRRACEALIRAGIEVDARDIWPLLGDKDRFVRTAARLVLQRIEPRKWVERLWQEKDFTTCLEAMVALCKTNQAAPYADQLFKKLDAIYPAPVEAFDDQGGKIPESVLQARYRAQCEALIPYMRTLQLVFVHTSERPESAKRLARTRIGMPTTPNASLNRELAILATYARREKLIDTDVHRWLLEGLLSRGQDRLQQLHYAYCLRLLHDGWTADQRHRLLTWYESTKTWSGGHSFTPFLENILRDWMPVVTKEDRAKVFAEAEKMPHAAALLLQTAPADQLPAIQELDQLHANLAKFASQPKVPELREAILTTIARDTSKEAESALRGIADREPSAIVTVARALGRSPNRENFPYLLKGLAAAPPNLGLELVDALRKSAVRPQLPEEPRAEDAKPFRLVLELSARLSNPDDKWRCAELLRHWTGRKFSVGEKDWKGELSGWALWFNQTFPKEPPLPNVTAIEVQTKWKFDELLAYLEKDPKGKAGDPVNGRKIFEKASCAKCHKFGSLGEGLGPDLTTLKGRFKRADMLEALLAPSRVISDQYRGSKILTTEGKRYDGLAAVQGDTVTIVLHDASKVTLKMAEIKQMVASTVSPMPDLLLDPLTKEEIADLFAFLDGKPPE